MLASGEPLLTRRAASDYLRSHGFPVAVATLASFVTRGGGPSYHKFGPRVLYRPGELLEWAETKLSKSIKSSSQGEADK